MATRSGIPLIDRAESHGERIAVVDAAGEHTYARLEARSRARALQLLGRRSDLEEARVAFLFPPGFEYVVTQWAIWRAGGIAVPLSPLHPVPELEYILDDTSAEMVVTSAALEERLRPLAETRGARVRSVPDGGYPVEPILPFLAEEEVANARPAPVREADLPALAPGRRGMILYTSGTTARPKGVVSTHGQLDAQIRTLVGAWEWTAGDRILHVLPLHHTHGIVNALACALYAGATVEMPGGFDAAAVWEAFASGRITLFMAVPTVYAKLLAALEAADEPVHARWCGGARSLRLMVSGSAALPVPLFERWEAATGHRLLERYGMTEIGMALSNPLHGERRPGTVGRPLPGVEVRLVASEDGRVPARATHDRTEVHEPTASGEIQVRGPGVFDEYWRKPEETRAAFADGWFRTGDEATIEDGYWRILGRRSVDIIKTGGYKVSALEIEDALCGHPAVAECAVVGVPDPEWGEVVCAAVVRSGGAPAGEGRAGAAALPERLDAWLRERLTPYKRPRRWAVLDALPRNAMGKVTKPSLRPLFEPATGSREREGTGPPPVLLRFAELVNRREYWASHEVLEDAWRDRGSEFYHGLILYASAFVHALRGNAHGISAQLGKALERLDPYPSPYLGLDVGEIREHARRCRTLVESRRGDLRTDWETILPLPRLDPRGDRVRGDEPELAGDAGAGT